MKKKKGFALLYTLAFILILTAFALSLLSLAFSNRVTTKNLEKSNQLKLIAESGIDAGLAKLKNELSNDTSGKYTEAMAKLIRDAVYSEAKFQIDASGNIILVSDISGNPITLDNNIKLKVTAKEAKRTDPKSGNDIACIQITSTATSAGRIKTIDAYIDERDMTNVYYDKMFNNYDKGATNDNSEIITNSSLSSLGITIPTFNDPSAFYPYSSVKSITDFTTLNYAAYASSFENTSTMYIFKCKKDTTENVDVNQVINLVAGYVNYLRAADAVTHPVPDYINNQLPTFKFAGEMLTPVDTSTRDYINDMIDYTKKYKLILIDGDATLKLDFPIVNYIIYCTGTLTIDQSTLDNNKLYNCSIVASQIIDPNPTLTNMNMYGITNPVSKGKIYDYLFMLDATPLPVDPLVTDGTSLKSLLTASGKSVQDLFPDTANGDFSLDDRKETYDKLFSLLDGFQNGYRFKIIDWVER